MTHIVTLTPKVLEERYKAICKATQSQHKTMSNVPPDKRLGYAVVGLGKLSLEEILPALSLCKYAKLAALVSGDADKAREVAHRYGIAEDCIYNYQNFDEIRHNEEVDIVYIVLPNSMHHEYTLRSARAGKHVLCEKPMANSVRECEEMIDACRSAGRKLMVAYRIQYEAYNLQVMEWLRNKQYGKVKVMEFYNGQNAPQADHWRLKKALSGGGALPDIGIYCLNTARFLLGEEPVSVFAQMHSTPDDPRFKEVEESMTFMLRFPSGALVNCATSYGTEISRNYRIYMDKASLLLDPAFSYSGLQLYRREKEGAMEWDQQGRLVEKNQFSEEMDQFAAAIACGREPYTRGEEGLQDMRIMEALYTSARENRMVDLQTYDYKDVFRGDFPV